MPAKKSAKQSANGRKRKSTAARARKTTTTAAKRIGSAAKKTRKRASKTLAGAGKRVKAVASNPRRTVRKAADNVHHTATRARDLGGSVITAGELIREAADFVDGIAQRAKTRTTSGRKTTKTSR